MAPTVSREVSHEGTKARRIQSTCASRSCPRVFVPSCESCRHFLRGWKSSCGQILLRRRLVIVNEAAQEGEGQHGVVKVIRIHRHAQWGGESPQGVAQLFLVGVGHVVLFSPLCPP